MEDAAQHRGAKQQRKEKPTANTKKDATEEPDRELKEQGTNAYNGETGRRKRPVV